MERTERKVWIVLAGNGYGEDTYVDSVWDNPTAAEARSAELNAKVAGPLARVPGERTTWAEADEYEVEG